MPLLVASCGGAAEVPQTPSPAPSFAPAASSADLATPDGAYAAVARAEGELALALGASGRGAVPGEAPPQPAPEPPPPPPPPSLAQPPAAPVAPAAPPPAAHAQGKGAPATKAEELETTRRSAPASGGCASACAALASMERATDHLCTLAGAQDARCSDARARVKSATDRVRATCPSCGG